jgi:hypothetical protein
MVLNMPIAFIESRWVRSLVGSQRTKGHNAAATGWPRMVHRKLDCFALMTSDLLAAVHATERANHGLVCGLETWTLHRTPPDHEEVN